MSGRQRLRFGVIGTGAFAEACHIPGLQAHPQAEVAAICGRRRDRTQAVADRFGIATVTTEPADLCARSDIDGIAICTPNASHCADALLALGHGKHVFCEKPLALSVAEAETMVRLAASSGRVHQVAFTFRYLYGVEELRRRVHAGEIGEPLLFRAHHEHWDGLRPGSAIGWRGQGAAAGGGVLQDTGAHLVDLARFVMGPIAAIRADMHHVPRQDVESDDIATAWLRFASGQAGYWHASRITPPRAPNAVQVIGREGALEALLSRGGFDALRRARSGPPGWEELPLVDAARDGQTHALTRMMRSFVDACLRGSLAAGDASFHDGLIAQRVLAAAQQSAGTDWIALDPEA